MQNSQLFSRRNTDRKVDFRLDPDTNSPSSQLRRLRYFMEQPNPTDADDISNCQDALDALREFSYRKIFTGTSHNEYKALEASDPKHIDWQIAVHEAESERFLKNKKQSEEPRKQNMTVTLDGSSIAETARKAYPPHG